MWLRAGFEVPEVPGATSSFVAVEPEASSSASASSPKKNRPMWRTLRALRGIAQQVVAGGVRASCGALQQRALLAAAAVATSYNVALSTEDPQQRPIPSGALDGTQTELRATYDSYGGVLVEPESVKKSSSLADFHARLVSSITAWRELGKRGIWLKIPVEQVELLAVATGLGFALHHCEADYVMCTYWLPAELGIPNTLPAYTSHTVGVGAVVINEKGEVLVVQEKSGPAANIDFWKYPTGMVEPGEDAAAAAVREVKEETGIDAEVIQLVSFREAHTPQNSTWQSGKTNIFMVFLLKPTSSVISKQDSEIAACKWLPLVEYWIDAEKRMKPGTLYHAMLGLTYDAHNGSIMGFAHSELPLGFRPGSNMLYFPAEASACVAERLAEQKRLAEHS